ncbi:bifunctional hydroxymethylpyrimidine kinase/phosphomethylpyrimidine kinase [Candidatus Leptofilum sp.]|uniref:bifunctional hydroxymethylpyrimidine kinase/phosphomethylpyrimidine kinase n=1 Tax=Candidatus Leptofilum sp. TaxID=3241576 RepID=UPI003B594435
MMSEPVKLLTIGGSDSGGAAGIQADLKTWTVLGGYGMSVVTAVTAQNSLAVQDVTWMSPRFVQAQLEAVLSDYGATAVKTGFLGRTELVIAVSATLQKYKPAHIVVDPVLVNHRGQQMFPDAVRQLYLAYLLPIADLVTPNLVETAVLLQTSSIDSYRKLRRAAARLHQIGAKNVLIKGFRDGAELVNVLYDGQTFIEFRQSRLDTHNTHGSGDTLSAAICAFLAQGVELKTVVSQAQQFTHRAIQHATDWQLGGGHGPLAIF